MKYNEKNKTQNNSRNLTLKTSANSFLLLSENFSHYTITHKFKSETNHKILIKK